MDNIIKGNFGSDDESSPPAPPIYGTSLAVLPVYPLFGAQWNDYVYQDNGTYDSNDVSCIPGTHTKCLQGGELRKVVLPTASCTGLRAEDELAVFEWSCQEVAGKATFYSSGFKYRQGLGQLLTTTAWKDNRILVKQGAVLVGASPLAKWWSNQVLELPDNSGGSPLNLDGTDDDGPGPDVVVTPGTILVLGQDLTTPGYNIDQNKISVVVLPGFTMTYSDGGNNCDASDGETGVANECLLAAGGQDHLWLEGQFDGSGSANLAYGLLYFGVRFSVMRSVNFTKVGAALYLGDSDYNRVENIQSSTCLQGSNFSVGSQYNHIQDIRAFGCTNHGLYVQSAFNNLFENVYVANNGWGIRLMVGAGNNQFYGVTAANNALHSVQIDGSSNNLFHNIRVLAGGDHGIYVESGNGNIISHYTVMNVVNSSTLINSGNNNIYLQGLVANGGRGVDLSGTSDGNQFYNTSLTNMVNDAVFLNGVTNTSFGGIFKQGGNGDNCNITGGSGNQIAETTTGNNCQVLHGENIQLDSPNVATSFNSPIKDDSKNADTGSLDGSGYLTFASITDWLSFDNLWRGWAKGANLSLLDPTNNDSCQSGQDCAIWDMRPKAGDREVRLSSMLFLPGQRCPALAHGNHYLTAASGDRFLTQAYEIRNDEIGDDDGLCETNEACIYSPHMGAYQGEGTLVGPCSFINGRISGVNLYAYELDEMKTTFTVNSTDDEADANPGDGKCETITSDECTLRAAIEETNALGSYRVINIPDGTYQLSLGEMTISTDMTINGTSKALTRIDAQAASRIFNVSSGVHLDIRRLRMDNGRLTTGAHGGGMLIIEAHVTLFRVGMDNNRAESGGEGGAIWQDGQAGGLGSLRIYQSSFTNNFAAGTGAVRVSSVDTFLIENSTFDTNSTTGSGTIACYGTHPHFRMVSITNNTSASGASAIHLGNGGPLVIENSTISGNSGSSYVIYNNTRVHISHSTIANNSTSTGVLRNNNASDTYWLKHVILSDNVGGDNCSQGVITSEDYNISDDATCSLIQGNDQPSTDPLLDGLLDNGMGLSHELLPGSPAIDTGGTTCHRHDQNGISRPRDKLGGGALCDIGAVEML